MDALLFIAARSSLDLLAALLPPLRVTNWFEAFVKLGKRVLSRRQLLAGSESAMCFTLLESIDRRDAEGTRIGAAASRRAGAALECAIICDV